MNISNRLGGRLLAAGLLLSCAMPDAHGAVIGYIDDFAGPGTGGWQAGSQVSNPGSGGAGGAGDGYLLVSSASAANFGTQNISSAFTGDWNAAGIEGVSFQLSDVGADQSFNFHFLLTSGGVGGTTWQHDGPFDPPSGSWQQYSVDVTSETAWTRTRGTQSLAEVLQNVTTAHFRHDLPPYFSFPDTIAGELGIDNITLVPEPAGATALMLVSLPILQRRRRTR